MPAPRQREAARAGAMRALFVRITEWVAEFMIGLVGDFIDGVVEREQDVLAKRHPWRGLGMFFEKIEIGLGVELNAFPPGRVLRLRINPLLAVLEKGAAVHEF